jgi:structural maintenance of chromosome 4
VRIITNGFRFDRLRVDETEEELKVPILNEDEHANYSMDDLQNEIHILQEEVNALKPDMSALRVYREKSKVYEERVTELNTITTERDEKRTFYEDLRKRRCAPSATYRSIF